MTAWASAMYQVGMRMQSPSRIGRPYVGLPRSKPGCPLSAEWAQMFHGWLSDVICQAIVLSTFFPARMMPDYKAATPARPTPPRRPSSIFGAFAILPLGQIAAGLPQAPQRARQTKSDLRESPCPLRAETCHFDPATGMSGGAGVAHDGSRSGCASPATQGVDLSRSDPTSYSHPLLGVNDVRRSA